MNDPAAPLSVLSKPKDDIRLWTAQEREHSLQTILKHWEPTQDVWVYAYGSLIWRPEFTFLERRCAVLRGYHRALCLWSRINRGTPDCPGLVFGLDRGGSCRGVVYKLAARDVPVYFPALWEREMSTGSYEPRWLSCHTESGPVTALVFTMNRDSPSYIRDLPNGELLAIIERASGQCGTCVDYVVQTALALEQAGIDDPKLNALATQLQARQEKLIKI